MKLVLGRVANRCRTPSVLAASSTPILLTPPLDDLGFVALLGRAYLAIGDSGGVQEAPSFGVLALVTRAATERGEALTAGTPRLVGTERDAVIAAAQLLDEPAAEAAMRAAANPFGDGRAAARIVAHLEQAPPRRAGARLTSSRDPCGVRRPFLAITELTRAQRAHHRHHRTRRQLPRRVAAVA